MNRAYPDLGRPVLFGTRGSALALAQTDRARARFSARYPHIEVQTRVIRTEGDLDTVSPLTEIGGRGVFTNAIEAAVLRGDVDAAVHSAKDLPSALHPHVPIVAFPERDDPRDALVSRHGATLAELPPNPVIGTSSRRRAVQIAQLRPDARIVSIRGNIDTRLRKAAGPDLDAIVLAAAGLRRLGLSDRISELFAVERLVPSPGQGAIAIQATAGADVAALLATIDDAAVSAPVRIERAFLASLGAGCSVPVGAHVRATPDGFHLVAMLADPSGSRVERVDEALAPGDEAAHAAEIASRLAVAVGARERTPLGVGFTPDPQILRGARVVVTRPRRQAEPLLAALSAAGAELMPLPTIRIEPVADPAALDAALRGACAGEFDSIVFTSANAVEAISARLTALGLSPRRLATLDVAAIGPATAAAATELGLAVSLVPGRHTAEALAAELRNRLPAGSRVLYPRSAIGRDLLPEALQRAGFDIVSVVAYHTLPESETTLDPGIVARLARGDADAIVFASPSSVQGLLDLLGDRAPVARDIPAVSAGPVTAEAARAAGFKVVAVSAAPDASSIVAALAAWWRGQNGASRPRADAGLAMLSGRSAG